MNVWWVGSGCPWRILLLTLALTGLPGCFMVAPGVATVTYYDFGAGLPVILPLDAYPVTLLVRDLRPEVVSRRKNPLYVGMAENGMGESRDVFNRDDCPVPVSVHATPHCRSLADSVALRLKSPATTPKAGASKGMVIVELKSWSTRAGSTMTLDYAIELYVRSATGENLAASKASANGENIDVERIGEIGFFNHAKREEQLSVVVANVLDDKLKSLLTPPVTEALRDLR